MKRKTIEEILDLAHSKFPEITPDNDYDFCEFVSELLNENEYANIWVCSFPNCEIVVHDLINDKFYVVDYMSYSIREIDCDEAIYLATTTGISRDGAIRILEISE